MFPSRLAALILTAMLYAHPSWAADFLEAIEDLPLMPGLAEQAGSGVSFPSAAGRIVEAEAWGEVSQEAVLGFYAQALPQLGWTADGPQTFRRESEVLRLAFSQAPAGGATLVRFSLSPAPR